MFSFTARAKGRKKGRKEGIPCREFSIHFLLSNSFILVRSWDKTRDLFLLLSCSSKAETKQAHSMKQIYFDKTEKRCHFYSQKKNNDISTFRRTNDQISFRLAPGFVSVISRSSSSSPSPQPAQFSQMTTTQLTEEDFSSSQPCLFFNSIREAYSDKCRCSTSFFQNSQN